MEHGRRRRIAQRLKESQDHLYRQDKTQPYDVKDTEEVKRYVAQKVGTHYAYDWLELFHQVCHLYCE